MKKLNFLIVAAVLGAATAFTSCSDEMVQPQTKSSAGELLSRGAYDYPAVEWDNVDKIAVACNLIPSVTELPVPWDGGQSGNDGIPEDWLDGNRRNSDPKQRAYSRQNGWDMVCHNLSDLHSRPNISDFTTSIPECSDCSFMRSALLPESEPRTVGPVCVSPVQLLC